MYIQHTVHISYSIDDCVLALAHIPRTWFPGLKADGSSRVGLKVAGVPLRKRVSVELGHLFRQGSWAEVPISWKATSASQLFPIFNGKVELAPVDPTVTRLTMSGMYEPPLGRLGAELDDVLMHRVAEATVKELAEAISRELEKKTD